MNEKRVMARRLTGAMWQRIAAAVAAHRYHDTLAAHEAGIVLSGKFSFEMRGYVFDPVTRIELPHTRHARQRHFLQALDRW